MKSIIGMTYEKLFALYLVENTPLIEIDKMLNKKIGPNTLSDFNIGQPIQGLNYFRLLSKAHTERLSDEDIAIFEKLIDEMDEKIMPEARAVVERTFRDVMCANLDEPDKMTCIGPYPDVDFCFDNDAIVLSLVIDNVLDMSETDLERIQDVAGDMKDNLFTDISKDMGVKLDLFVSIG